MNFLAVVASFGLVGPLVGPLGGRPALMRPAAQFAPASAGVVMQFGRRKEAPSAEPTEEIVAAFRMLGIAEDATYEAVETAYAELLERYAGQTKQTIKLQIAKDKILDFRLRQRMTGAIRPDKKRGAPAAERVPWLAGPFVWTPRASAPPV